MEGIFLYENSDYLYELSEFKGNVRNAFKVSNNIDLSLLDESFNINIPIHHKIIMSWTKTYPHMNIDELSETFSFKIMTYDESLDIYFLYRQSFSSKLLSLFEKNEKLIKLNHRDIFIDVTDVLINFAHADDSIKEYYEYLFKISGFNKSRIYFIRYNIYMTRFLTELITDEKNIGNDLLTNKNNYETATFILDRNEIEQMLTMASNMNIINKTL